MTQSSTLDVGWDVHKDASAGAYWDTMGQAMHVEHIDPNGGDDPKHVCLACPTCNLSKAIATSALG